MRVLSCAIVAAFSMSVHAATCPEPSGAHSFPTAGNCEYDVVLNDQTGGIAAGTGQDHPVTAMMGRRDTLPIGGGRILAPFERSLSIRSWLSHTDYRFDVLVDTLLMDYGYRCVPVSELSAGSVERIRRADGQVVGLVERWIVDEGLDHFEVSLRIQSHGNVFEDSAVEITATIENRGPDVARIGSRLFFSTGMLGASGVALAAVPPAVPSEPWTSREGQWLEPEFDHLLASWTNSPSIFDPYYFGGMSVRGPWPLDPAPTVPEAIVRAADVTGSPAEERSGPGNTCFAWEAPDPPRGGPTTPGGGGDEALVYYWGRTAATAVDLESGQSRSFTIWSWAFVGNPVTCDAGTELFVECSGRETRATLDGSSSHTVEGNQLLYRWSSPNPLVVMVDAGTPRPTLLAPATGTYPITLDVGIGPFTGVCETRVNVVDTTAPVLHLPADLVVRTSEFGPRTCAIPLEVVATATDVCSSHVAISHVTDPLIGSGDSVAAYAYPVGTTRVQFRARDDSGNTATGLVRVTVIDDTPPVFETLRADPHVLWPPNHQLVDVAVSLEVADNCDVPSVTLVDVVSSEPEDLRGDGRTGSDIEGASLGQFDTHLRLRAEREGMGPGRVYAVRYEAADASGNRSESAATVEVPHDQRRQR